MRTPTPFILIPQLNLKNQQLGIRIPCLLQTLFTQVLYKQDTETIQLVFRMILSKSMRKRSENKQRISWNPRLNKAISKILLSNPRKYSEKILNTAYLKTLRIFSQNFKTKINFYTKLKMKMVQKSYSHLFLMLLLKGLLLRSSMSVLMHFLNGKPNKTVMPIIKILSGKQRR